MEKDKRLAEIITDIIFHHTSCDYHKDEGYFSCEIYADYRDYAENNTIIKWCEADNPREAFNENLFGWYQDLIFEYEDDVIDTVKKYWTDEELSFDDNEEFIVDWIREHVTVELPTDHYLQQKFAWISSWIPATGIMTLFAMTFFRTITQDLEM